jgi:hypothetical protein
VSLRAELLSGRRIALAGGDGAPIGPGLERLGAWVDTIEDEQLLDEAVAAAWVTQRRPLNALVFDAAAGFGPGGQTGLGRALELAWLATRAIATGALIADQGPGQLVLIGPRPDAGIHAEAARAGLENLARTLSVEWARFSVTAVAICPGSQTTDEELTELVCFVLSAAGQYLSGCRLDLGRAHDELIRAS